MTIANARIAPHRSSPPSTTDLEGHQPRARVIVGGDDSPTFDHGAVGRWNAWFFATFDRYLNLVARRHKDHAFAGIEPGTIVELGAGVGANFAHVPTGSRVMAIEPNEAMHDRLSERARARGLRLEIVGAPAERLPLPDHSVDTVIVSLVLCTVEDPAAALREVIRVLRPGGTFRFVEHVAAHPVSPRRWVQTAIARPWAWVFEGCQLCRDTEAVVAEAGFSSVDTRHGRLRRSVFFPVNSAISGVATR